MATTKVTFTLDAETLSALDTISESRAQPKSAVVREAIQDYKERIGRLGERERVRMLDTFDRVVPKIPRRPLGDLEREIEEIRRARRRGGRRHG